MSTGVNTSGKIKPSVRRNPWIRRAPSRRPTLVSPRLRPTGDSTAWCVTAVGLGAVVAGGGSVTAPTRSPHFDRTAFGFAVTVLLSNGQLVVLCVLTLLDALSYELRK